MKCPRCLSTQYKLGQTCGRCGYRNSAYLIMNTSFEGMRMAQESETAAWLAYNTLRMEAERKNPHHHTSALEFIFRRFSLWIFIIVLLGLIWIVSQIFHCHKFRHLRNTHSKHGAASKTHLPVLNNCYVGDKVTVLMRGQTICVYGKIVFLRRQSDATDFISVISHQTFHVNFHSL